MGVKVLKVSMKVQIICVKVLKVLKSTNYRAKSTQSTKYRGKSTQSINESE